MLNQTALDTTYLQVLYGNTSLPVHACTLYYKLSSIFSNLNMSKGESLHSYLTSFFKLRANLR